MDRTIVKTLFVVAGLAAAWPSPGRAQGRHMGEVHRNADGDVFDFHPDGAWRRLARSVAARRNALLARGDVSALNAAMAAPSTMPAAAAVTGVRRIPAVLFRFADNGTAPSLPASAGDTSTYRKLLFETTPPTMGEIGYSAPYTIRTFYSELSNTQLDLQGVIVGWYTLASNEDTYNGGQNCSGQNPYGNSNCNGIWSSTATTAMRAGLTEALTAADADVNFGLYDNDGPDGMPNSGDDDGFVDMLIFVHSEQDGACLSASNNHIWSHRSQMPSGGFSTGDARSGGGVIKVRDYTIQSGLGGQSGCTATQVMSIGTAAHETGHAFGLPDLYDTQQTTNGIGNWGLMGSGNQASGPSPARMEAWSLNELGWVTVVPLTGDTTVTFGPAATADTTFLVRVQGTNTRKEYYFLENRQAAAADTALIRVVCSRSGLAYPTNCRGGLAIWHMDSTKIQAGKPGNTVNTGSGPPGSGSHGVALVQADDLGQLDKISGGNQGDARDLWGAGFTGAKTRYSFDTSPAAKTNADTNVFVGFEVDQMVQVSPDGPLTFRLRFGAVTIVRALDTLAKVKVNDVAYGRFAGLFTDGVNYTVSMDSAQTTADGRTEFVWQSWSDGGARTHTKTGALAGDSVHAVTATRYKLIAGVTGTGTVASSPSVNHAAGAFVDKDAPMQLTATAGSGFVFERWTGDTNTTANPLTLPMGKPYTVSAVFNPVLALPSFAPTAPVMGKANYTFALTATGGTGSYTWSVVSGALPPGLSLATSGNITGTPTQAGDFTATVRATSGVQTSDAALSFTVAEPTLQLANVLGALLATGGAVSTDEARYLDLIGNGNNVYDVGDFLAWVDKFNVTPAAPPQTEQP